MAETGGRDETAGRDGTERVLIVGAGMAGLTLARTLADAGAAVTVAEKSRGIGGRMASRRTDHGTFDHGAQYVTGKGPPFRALLTGLSHDGTVGFWKPAGRDRPTEWHVGLPAMSKMLTPMLGGFELRLRTPVTAIERDGDGLHATFGEGADATAERFDRVLVTAPAPQARALLEGLGAPFDRLDEPSYAPCWTLMLAFERRIEAATELFRPDPGDPSPIGWAARNSSKPQREGGADLWIVNGTPAWSFEHLERAPGEIVPILSGAFADMVAGGEVEGKAVARPPEPVHAVAHRWRYSLVERPLGETHLLSEDGRVGACGDWCLAGRVEAAFESARALADAIKQRL